ncbi:XdhC family protein [Alteromonas pelagimontana]|uniref:XdhC family protein n=1 Tax=Alteromonas pelagimontana TaxID=1858656 RepID=A0A6M4M9T0_9ALTE|nr:XdhC family protein [Alteromonas pelagimontana]QJR79395.1 XdhC family protein [Alteromonas pelagimontana]
MKHHLYHILRDWISQKDDYKWILVTVIGTRGSSYRKAGAMMLFNDTGKQMGMVSGGCLESDIFHHARKCWLKGHSKQVTYDMQEEGDIAWRLGIGCGGEVTLLLQPVNAENNYLHLPEVLERMQANQPVDYAQSLRPGPAASLITRPEQKEDWFVHRLTPPSTLLILGGGIDAIPLCDIAARIGWRVAVNDPRARYARSQDFLSATYTGESEIEDLACNQWYQQANAIVLMHHQVDLDAKAVALIARHPNAALQYLALLGPVHRYKRVLKSAKLQASALPVPICAPAGFPIGGELPESIALSILSQAHATLYEQQTHSQNSCRFA